MRDLLHVADLYNLLRIQIDGLERFSGGVFNVGGGRDVSVSLAELTEICARRAGRRLQIGADPETRAADIPWYVTDNTVTTAATGWRPQRSTDNILDDVFRWLADYRALLEPVLC